MIYYSYAKANIFLDVVSKYKNGFHGIKSIFLETDLYDKIEYTLNNSGSIKVIEKRNLLPENNLITGAYHSFFEYTKKPKIGIDIFIEKNIPIGGGLGGGSSNAAAILKILNKQTGNKLSNKELMVIGNKIGSDVPYFINSKTQKVFGKGEIITPIKTSFKELKALMVFPEEKISTPIAYSYIDKMNLSNESYHSKKNLKNMEIALKNGNLELLINSLYNKFEIPVFELSKNLIEIKNNMLKSGLDAVLMSGSGSTLLGFSKNYENINKSVDILKGIGYKTEAISFKF